MSLFYSEAILSRRGPLARVWLAAHYERKLSKTLTLQTDIEQSVDAIVDQEGQPMALRLSGQLLLGVVRIYSRKAKYLLDDCNEAIAKIKLAFRPGVVDMTEDQLTVPRNAITISADLFNIDLMLPDANWDLSNLGQSHIARDNDITLSTAEMNFGFMDDGWGFEGDGIGSQDWGGFDAGISFGDDEPGVAVGPDAAGEGTAAAAAAAAAADETMSVELGRHDAGPGSPRISLDTRLEGRPGDFERDVSVLSKGREPSHLDFGGGHDDGFGFPSDFNLGGEDLGISFGEDVPLADPEREKTPGQANSRASSPLTTPPPLTPPNLNQDSISTPTPKTAARIARIAEQRENAPERKKRTKKLQIIDEVTELKQGPGARGRRGLGDFKDPDVSAITTEQRFLPRSTTVMRLLEIRADPLAYFMPTTTTSEGTFFYAGPPGVAPELRHLFMFPVHDHRRPRTDDTDPRSPKRARIAVPEEESPGVARRAESEARFSAFGGDVTGGKNDMDVDMAGLGDYVGAEEGGISLDLGGGIDPMGMDIDGEPEGRKTPVPRTQREMSLIDDTRSSPGLRGDEEFGLDSYDAQSCSIGIFDMRSKEGESQSQTQTQEEEIERSTEQVQSKGYSKNTVKAIAVIRKGLEAEEGEGDEKWVSFNKVAEKASRRAASAFFFELLVLTTRDCLKVSQEELFGNIEIRAKEKLWESLSNRLPTSATAIFDA
ncbi:Rec8 like protein-domain-containing protein [Cantharellus anzutake]|uniref:Rec8 like protein-domain-containing protein n=1 Tax=Cantharellus anzutake TaxID=1750568 RepID=UPI001907CE1A|nr:Rec8 like protein-domain-containing protein [Cantharellus anzutake]KAF8325208.1 Rec8 like protein-domain-containing protein [Cantharellus anzutake]